MSPRSSGRGDPSEGAPASSRLRSRTIDHRPVVFGLPIRAATHHRGHTEGVNAMNVLTSPSAPGPTDLAAPWHSASYAMNSPQANRPVLPKSRLHATGEPRRKAGVSLLRRSDHNTQLVDPVTESGTITAEPTRSADRPGVAEGLARHHDRTTVVYSGLPPLRHRREESAKQTWTEPASCCLSPAKDDVARQRAGRGLLRRRNLRGFARSRSAFLDFWTARRSGSGRIDGTAGPLLVAHPWKPP